MTFRFFRYVLTLGVWLLVSALASAQDAADAASESTTATAVASYAELGVDYRAVSDGAAAILDDMLAEQAARERVARLYQLLHARNELAAQGKTDRLARVEYQILVVMSEMETEAEREAALQALHEIWDAEQDPYATLSEVYVNLDAYETWLGTAYAPLRAQKAWLAAYHPAYVAWRTSRPPRVWHPKTPWVAPPKYRVKSVVGPKPAWVAPRVWRYGTPLPRVVAPKRPVVVRPGARKKPVVVRPRPRRRR